MKSKIKFFSSAAILLAVLAVPATVSLAAGFAPPNVPGLPGGTITEIVTAVMNWLLVLVGIFGVIGFAIAGILYLISAGDETKAGTAKNAMMFSIIGVIVAILGLVIIKAAQSMLGGQSTTF